MGLSPHALPPGQYRLYSNLVRAGNGKIIVVLCQHETPPANRYRQGYYGLLAIALVAERDADKRCLRW